MVLRTLANMKVSQDEVPLLPEYKNEDDKAFVKELFRHTLVHYKEYFDYIGRFTKNWDVERIAFMDNLIMAATMSELINFPSIPVKVTLDEFIEIAKYYSTPGSSTFMAWRVAMGNTRSMSAMMVAQNRSSKNSFLCGR